MDIKEFNAQVSKSRNCSSCPLYKKGTFVGGETNDNKAEQKTVMFVGLNPGNEEAKQGRPFIGPSGQLLRKYMYRVKSWAIINSLLCHTANESAIPDGCAGKCRENLLKYWQVFHPAIIVPCGNGAASIFNIPDGISVANRNMYYYLPKTGRMTLIMPIFHPSAILRSGGESGARCQEFIARLNLIAEWEKKVDPDKPDLGIHKKQLKTFRKL